MKTLGHAVALGFFILVSLVFGSSPALAQGLTCGTSTSNAGLACNCLSGMNPYQRPGIGQSYCCGWVRNDACFAQDPGTGPVDPFITGGVTSEFFEDLNPLLIGGGNSLEETAPSAYAGSLSTPGGVITRFLQFAFPVAGVILFVMITWGGFEMILGASEKKSLDAGRQRITAAIVGFLLLFSSYWLTQIVSYVFGVVIL